MESRLDFEEVSESELLAEDFLPWRRLESNDGMMVEICFVLLVDRLVLERFVMNLSRPDSFYGL